MNIKQLTPDQFGITKNLAQKVKDAYKKSDLKVIHRTLLTAFLGNLQTHAEMMR